MCTGKSCRWGGAGRGRRVTEDIPKISRRPRPCIMSTSLTYFDLDLGHVAS